LGEGGRGTPEGREKEVAAWTAISKWGEGFVEDRELGSILAKALSREGGEREMFGGPINKGEKGCSAK